VSFPLFEVQPGVSNAPPGQKLDLFFDLQCPYSKTAWETVGESICNQWPDNTTVRFHAICLSHHRQSWNLARAMHTVSALAPELVFEFISAVYINHERFYNAQWSERGESELVDYLSDMAGALVNTTAKKFSINMLSDENFARSKLSIRYAALKQVWSTPTILWNEVEVPQISSSSTLEDWKKVVG